MNILITGASSGIGKSLSEYFVKEGSVVFGVARRKELLQEMKNKLPKDKFFFEVCNVENFSEVQKLKNKIEKVGFIPDVIILGAAISINDINPSFNRENFEKTFSVNLFGAMNFVEAFLPDFLKNNKGHFIALSSIAAFRPSYRGVSYPASKSALSLSFRSLDIIYRKKNVYFSNIYLGPVETQMWEGKKSFLVASPEKVAKDIAKIIKTKKSSSFIPFFSTFLFRISRLVPDKIYSFISENIIKT